MILPGLSASYGSSVDPPDDSIPVCTLKTFPYVVEHCVQWARDLFEGEFRQAPRAINTWLAAPDALRAHLTGGTHQRAATAQDEGDGDDEEAGGPESSIRAVYEATARRPRDAAGCVAWAVRLFNRMFDASIRDLLVLNPPDKVSETGAPFWSGA